MYGSILFCKDVVVSTIACFNVFLLSLLEETCASRACKYFAIFSKGIFGIFYIEKVPYKRKQYVIKGKLDLQIKGKSHAVHAKMLRKTDVSHGITFWKTLCCADPTLTRKNISDCF